MNRGALVVVVVGLGVGGVLGACVPRTASDAVAPASLVAEPRTPRRTPAAPPDAIQVPHPAANYVAAPASDTAAPRLLGPLLARADRVAAARGFALRLDERLVRAARALVGVPRLGALTAPAVLFAARACGVLEPSPHLVAGEVERASPEGIDRALGRAVAEAIAQRGYNRLGGAWQARPGGGLRVVLLLAKSHLVTEPIPRRANASGSVLLRGQLAPGYVKPRLVVTIPQGATRQRAVVVAPDGRFHAVLPLGGGDGIYRVGLLADGPGGPELLANFPLYVGLPLPSRFISRPPASAAAPIDPHAAARELFVRLNAARQAARRRLLRWDRALATVATRHSAELCREGGIRHISARTGSAADRVRRAGIAATWVAENLGRAATPEAVHEALLRSPAHRENLLRADMTHVGIGVCLVGTPSTGGRELVVTQLFVRR